MQTRIIIADDHQLFRQGLRSLIERQAGMVVIGEAADGREAITLALQESPDLMIIDITMPNLNGIEATRQILLNNKSTKVIGLSIHSKTRFVSELLRAGALGYILKDCALEELLTAVHTVLQGKMYLSPDIAERVIKDYVALSLSKDSVFTVLTAREREVLQLITEGKKTREIADSLHVSIKTVECFRQSITDKLHIHSIAELTKYAIREGLTTFDS
jgi:DNA-binding NarL/FixJ family response regulator